MSIQALKVERGQKLEEARIAALAGQIDTAKSLRMQAEGIDAQIDEIQKIEALAPKNTGKSFTTPVPLPGNSNGNNGLSVAEAAYVRRFRTVDESVKGILTDLHGNDFIQQYHNQFRVFKGYMRYGDKFLKHNDESVLKQIIMTPDIIEMALVQGADDVGLIKSTMVEAIDTLGGYTVPVDFQNKILERVRAEAVIRRRAMVSQTSRDTVEIPVGTGGDDQFTSAVRVTWVDETPVAGVAATNLTFGMESVPINTVMAEGVLSRNMVEDAMFNIENYLVEKFGESIEIDEDNQFTVGSGLGAPQGVLPGGSNIMNLARKASGNASALTWDGLIAMEFALPERYRKNAVWLAKRGTYEEIRKLKNTAGNYLWSPDQYKGGEEASSKKLLGYQIVEQESMPAVAAGSYPIVFGDFRGYAIFDRVGMTVERFLDSTQARTNTVMYVLRRRMGAQLVEPWRFAVQQVAAS